MGGGIDALLQNPRSAHPSAFLRGDDYYLPRLRRMFAQLCDARVRPTWEIGVPSGNVGHGYVDLDLFVTGTFCQGIPLAFFDARTAPIFSPSYAGVFHLKHRPHRSESHFDPDRKMREPFRVAGPRDTTPPAATGNGDTGNSTDESASSPA